MKPSPPWGEGKGEGRYLFPEFLPAAVGAFSSRRYDASRDIPSFLELIGASRNKFCTVQQVHGDRIILAEAPCLNEEEAERADGLLTAQRHLALVIRTADCMPVFFLDPQTPSAGVVHAGWRGAKKEIIFRMVEMLAKNFGAKPSRLWVGIGPAIRKCCYRVGREFENYFPGFVKYEKGLRQCDLAGFVKAQLEGAGVPAESIIDCRLCTSCSVDQFFSARREGNGTGRLISVIVLR